MCRGPDPLRRASVQLASRDAPAACIGDAVDQIKQLFRAIARQRGDKHDRRVIEKFESRPHDFFVIDEQLRGIDSSGRGLPARHRGVLPFTGHGHVARARVFVFQFTLGFFGGRSSARSHLFITMMTDRPDCSA